MSVTPNCARHWSIRRQPPRCWASSAARRRTCSRCLMPSLRVPLGFVELMMFCCDSEKAILVTRAHFGSILIGRIEISIDEPQYRWLGEHGTLHVPDVRAQDQFPTMGAAGNWPTMLFVPLRQQGELIGNLPHVAPRCTHFQAQVKFLETFADQAVIAIENVRLFNELKESLEQQKPRARS